MNKRKLKMGINIALILLCVVCVGVFAYAYPRISRLRNALNQIETDDGKGENNEKKDEKDTGYWNIVLFGLDSRDANSLTTMNTSDYGDKRSDCIMIISINRETGDVKLLSVFRDTYLQMRKKNFYETGDYMLDKATHAYFYGSANLLPTDETKDAGPYFSIDMLERNLDLEIDNFVSVNFGIVANVIDALGGVELELTKAECADINQYIDEINKITGSNSDHIVEPGKYVLDGVQATAYGRVRHTAGNDFKRAERQRTVMMLAAKKAQSASIDTLINLVELVAPQVRTDLTTDQMLSLVNSVRKYNVDSEDGQTGFPFERIDDPSYVFADDLAANVSALHEFLYGVKNYVPSDTVQEISDLIDEKIGISRNDDDDEDSSVDPYQNHNYGSDDDYDPDYYEDTEPDDDDDDSSSSGSSSSGSSSSGSSSSGSSSSGSSSSGSSSSGSSSSGSSSSDSSSSSSSSSDSSSSGSSSSGDSSSGDSGSGDSGSGDSGSGDSGSGDSGSGDSGSGDSGSGDSGSGDSGSSDSGSGDSGSSDSGDTAIE